MFELHYSVDLSKLNDDDDDINWNMLKADNYGDKFLKLVMDCYVE